MVKPGFNRRGAAGIAGWAGGQSDNARDSWILLFALVFHSAQYAAKPLLRPTAMYPCRSGAALCARQLRFVGHDKAMPDLRYSSSAKYFVETRINYTKVV